MLATDEWIAYEDPYIYDGWILQYSPYLKEIKWRDFYVTNRMSSEKKLEIESEVKQLFKSYDN